MASAESSSSADDIGRLRKLFNTCDGDRDGFINSDDLRQMCDELNMSDMAHDIIRQLGLDKNEHISFDDFCRCRKKVLADHDTLPRSEHYNTGRATSTSGQPESADYDSGARDLSPEPNRPDCNQFTFEHAARVVGRQNVDEEDEDDVLAEFNDRLREQALHYEEQITELHSVIAELRKKGDRSHIPIIREEDEYEEGSITDDDASYRAIQSQASLDLSNDCDFFISDQNTECQNFFDEKVESSAQPQSTSNGAFGSYGNAQPDFEVDDVVKERDQLKRQVDELQSKLSQVQQPTPSQSQESNTQSPKLAELKKLRSQSSIAAAQMTNTKIAEHLANEMKECSNQQEIIQTAFQNAAGKSSPHPQISAKVKEFEVEIDRLNGRIDHLKSQNDLLAISLDESRGQSDRLSELIGKYESNNTALQLAASYCDDAMEGYEALLQIVDTQQAVLLANCKAAGLYGIANEIEDSNQTETENLGSVMQRAVAARKAAEAHAKQLLQKLDRTCTLRAACAWEDASSNSRTTSTTSSTASSADTEFTRLDENRLRDYLQQLRSDRAAVGLTVTELESIHVEPLPAPHTGDTHPLDFENAVLMQEIMAMKEEKAELRAQNYLLGKEKQALELRLSGKESQEAAYVVQIEHLKSEMKEQHDKKETDSSDTATPVITLAQLKCHEPGELAEKLSAALKREKRLKQRITELVSTLEKLSKNSEIRHQQSAEFVNDLKRANSALVTAFEKAKKKYQARAKKQELQAKSMVDRFETQIRMLKQQIALLEDDSAGGKFLGSETCL